jgi:hypothetical protein
MAKSFAECKYMKGSPACGVNVIDMNSAYYDCENLTGSPVCGLNVIGMT